MQNFGNIIVYCRNFAYLGCVKCRTIFVFLLFVYYVCGKLQHIIVCQQPSIAAGVMPSVTQSIRAILRVGSARPET